MDWWMFVLIAVVTFIVAYKVMMIWVRAQFDTASLPSWLYRLHRRWGRRKLRVRRVRFQAVPPDAEQAEEKKADLLKGPKVARVIKSNRRQARRDHDHEEDPR